jgi:hypothetical protein
MFRNKKGDMTLNLIIGAAIAMIILVVLILIFTGKMNVFAGQSCATNVGGEVKIASQCGTNSQLDATCLIAGNFKDVGAGQVCCQKITRCQG